MRAPIPLVALVTPAERPVLLAAAGQLSESLTDPGEPGWPVRLRFAIDAAAPPPLLVVSLLGDVAGGEALDTVAARRDAQFAALAAGGEALFVCTLLRFVADRAARPALMPRIRALNLLATDLSHDHGAAVIDVDRVLALFGAGPLRTDYRLGGIAAPEVAAHVIVAALLANGLDAFVPVDRQERAIARHGGIHQIAATVDRRLQAAAPGAKTAR